MRKILLRIVLGCRRTATDFGWAIGLALITLTLVLGFVGFSIEMRENDSNPSTSDALYKAVSLIPLQSGDRPHGGNFVLNLARWAGVLCFASGLITLAVRLFRDAFCRLLVRALARDHVIVAGLGENGGQLVESLLAAGRTVVVLEPDRAHPALAGCEWLGALVLFGEPDAPDVLASAKLAHARHLLALFLDEPRRVRVVTAARTLMRAIHRTPGDALDCTLRLTEPGLLEVVRQHEIKHDTTDGLNLEVLNAHEIAAVTMVREASALHGERLRNVVVVGLGTHHRLGEMVLLRLAKDYLIERNGAIPEKLQVAVFDRHAVEWSAALQSRYPFLKLVCDITPHDVWARKVGPTAFDREYDAAFVCIADEETATAQAVMLRRGVLTNNQPIVVRVSRSQVGYGELLSNPRSGWGENICPVGLDDPLLEPHMALHPELELTAMAVHYEFRRRLRVKFSQVKTHAEQEELRRREANVPWARLSVDFRRGNRDNAARYDTYLASVWGAKTIAYRRAFVPLRDWIPGTPVYREFTDAEVIALAEAEHVRWLAVKIAQGWKYAPQRNDGCKESPFIRPYAELTPAQQRENSEYIRTIPYILALADYEMVEA